MYGVVDGIYYCGIKREEELNQRLYERNIPSNPLQAQFDIRPVSTKYALLPILDRRAKTTVPIIQVPTFDIGHTFNPGNAMAPWSGFAANVNNESDLRNQFFALQRAGQAEYVPSHTSDMYQNHVSARPEIHQPFPGLFSNTVLPPFNPNTCHIATNTFDNCTRQQIKNVVNAV
jgi:hypothetical protein